MRFLSSEQTSLGDIANLVSPPARELDPAAEQSVREMVAAVRERGDAAVIEYSRQRDWPDADIAQLRVAPADLAAAVAALDPADAEAIRAAIAHVRDYHEKHLPSPHFDAAEYGATIGWRYTPISAVGVYAPAGVAPLPSSLLMAAVPAQVAGVERVAVITPPRPDGSVNAGILAVAGMLGITEVYRVGGPWAIAALAYGTASIEPVDKIVGPGNTYVNLAKSMVAGVVGTDGFYGPSEVVILADEHANPRFVAADLAAQAEHFEDSLAVLVTPSRDLLDQVRTELDGALLELARADIVRKCLDRRGAMVAVRDLDEGIELVNLLATEHLELMVADTRAALAQIKHAGCILVGANSPTAVSDYLAGPSHVLPTARSARFSSGLGVLDFMKRSSIVAISPEWLQHNGRHVTRLAEMEGLQAHARSVRVRGKADQADA